jgi:hypothetical protein
VYHICPQVVNQASSISLRASNWCHTLIQTRAQSLEPNLVEHGFVLEHPTVVRVVVDDVAHCAQGEHDWASAHREQSRTMMKQCSPHCTVQPVVDAVEDALTGIRKCVSTRNARTSHQKRLHSCRFAEHRQSAIPQVLAQGRWLDIRLINAISFAFSARADLLLFVIY